MKTTVRFFFGFICALVAMPAFASPSTVDFLRSSVSLSFLQPIAAERVLLSTDRHAAVESAAVALPSQGLAVVGPTACAMTRSMDGLIRGNGEASAGGSVGLGAVA